IYENIDFKVDGSFNNWTITLTVKSVSNIYTGTAKIDIFAKINVISLNWTSGGKYLISMNRDQILNEFKINNQAGQHDLPKDLYQNVDLTTDPSSKWIINITTKNTSNLYIGQQSISISVTGSITYNGQTYTLADDLDVNCFCGTGELNVPLANNANLTIQYHTGITEIVFPAHIRSTHINDFFLFNFDKLKSIDLSNFNSVTSIGNRFLFGCGGLEQVNLSGLLNVKTIGFSFMYSCFQLESLDVSGLCSVESVGDYFLMNCDGLKNTLDLSPMSKLQTMGNECLSGCDNLKRIIMLNLNNLKSIGNKFLSGCTFLLSFDMYNSTLESIGDEFLYGCDQLISARFENIPNLKTIGNYFVNNCNQLTSITFNNLPSVKTIGDYFLYNCPVLESLDISTMTQVESIGDYFLTN
ncbi:MAG: leucine-rich repeat protein, partial [Malacoplasma sp.]|nr:leucine-rich repeat protein [Malacoplasma sp.]